MKVELPELPIISRSTLSLNLLMPIKIMYLISIIVYLDIINLQITHVISVFFLLNSQILRFLILISTLFN